MEPPSPQQLRHRNISEAGGSGEVDGGGEADIDDAASGRRVEGVETTLHVWETQHPQPPLTIAAEDLKLELSFEVELQLGGQRRLCGEGREDAQSHSQSDSSRLCLVACRDAAVQVTEEEISQYMGEEDNDHPLRILSQENMTVVSTFADSASGSYSLDGQRVRGPRRRQRSWRWGWETPPSPPPLCRSQSASAADVRLALRRPAADDDADVDDWEGSLASEPPPTTDRRLQHGLAAITPDLIRGARPAHRSLPAHRRTTALGGDGGVGGPGAPTVGGAECPWTLQRPDGASNPSMADHEPASTVHASAAATPRVWDSGTRPLTCLPHTSTAPHSHKEDAARRPLEVERYGVEAAPALRPVCHQRPGPTLLPPSPPPPPPPPLPASDAGHRRERTGSPALPPRLEPAAAAAAAMPAGARADGDVIPSWRQRLRMVASKLSCNCG